MKLGQFWVTFKKFKLSYKIIVNCLDECRTFGGGLTSHRPIKIRNSEQILEMLIDIKVRLTSLWPHIFL